MTKKNQSPQTSPSRSENQLESQLWRVRQVLAVYPVSRAKLYNDIRAGKFPKPIRLGERCVAWRASEVLNHIDALQA